MREKVSHLQQPPFIISETASRKSPKCQTLSGELTSVASKLSFGLYELAQAVSQRPVRMASHIAQLWQATPFPKSAETAPSAQR